MKPSSGDILFAVKYKGTYLHYGIYIGGNRVINYRTEAYDDNTWIHAKIIETSLSEFAHGSPIYREPERSGANWDFTTVRKAKKLLGSGSGEYHPLKNNCEHFANYCKYDKKESYQINRLLNKFEIAKFLLFQPLFKIVEHFIINNYIIPHNCEKIDMA